MKAAVIGIGSNSVRVLLAESGAGGMNRLWRDREGTRLFAGLESAGNLSEASVRKAAEAVGRMAADARARGAERVALFATSAARDARNGQAFIEEITRAAGVSPRILSGEEEACMSFFGASQAVETAGRCGVIDIGGGSTEVVTGRGMEIDCAFSCQMGAVRLFQAIQLTRRQDMPIAERAATDILRETMASVKGFRAPDTWVGTGGTFTTLAAMVKQIPWTERTCMHGTRISRAEVRRIGEQLADMTLAERKQLPGLQPGRADIVVHGGCILLSGMSRLGIGAFKVSEHGNLDGYIRKYYG